MNVIHLASSGELGGAEWVILDILAGIRETEPSWSVSLVVPHAGPLSSRAQLLGIPVRVVEWDAAIARLGDSQQTRRGAIVRALRVVRALPQIARYVGRLSRVLRAANPTIVHAHGFKMHLVGMWACPREVPVVLHLHDYIGRRRLMSRALRLRPPGRFVGAAISRSVAADAAPWLPGIPIVVVYNGIDTSQWTPAGPRLDLDQLAGLPDAGDRVRVGLVATMARWKGHHTFLHAIAALPRDLRYRAYVIGGSIYRSDSSQYDIAELRALGDHLGLGTSLGFTGHVADPAAAMRSLDIVVHASTLPEPFGRVIVEGMSLERAVVTSALGGAAELVEAGRSAATFTAGNSPALAAVIEHLIRDAASRRALGQGGRARARRLFDRRTMVSGLISLYRSLDDRSLAPAPATG